MARLKRSKSKNPTWQECLKTCSLTPKGAKVAGNCAWCGKKLPRNKDGSIPKRRRWCSKTCSYAFSLQHYWSFARKAALKRDKHQCTTCEAGARLQVHHLEAREGRGYGTGCWNHHANLLTQCTPCHQALTNEQRRARSSK